MTKEEYYTNLADWLEQCGYNENDIRVDDEGRVYVVNSEEKRVYIDQI